MSTAALTVRAGRGFGLQASLRRNRRWALITSYVFLVVFAIFFLIPPYYMIVTSLKSDAEVARMATNPWIVADGFTLDQFRILLTQTDFVIFFKNTVIVTLCVVAITMVVSVLAAFSLGRMKFWGSSILATGIFLTYLVPDTLLFIPLFQIVKALGLLNSYWGMVLVYPTLTVPFCTWIMIGYFQSIPKELDEAALIDGASHMQMLTKIFIPVALPGIIAATIFAFTVSWAAFVYPMAFLYSADQQVLTVGTVTSLIRGDVYKWGHADGRRAARRGTAARHLRVPHGLLHRRPDRRRHERLNHHGRSCVAQRDQALRRRRSGAQHQSRHSRQ